MLLSIKHRSKSKWLYQIRVAETQVVRNCVNVYYCQIESFCFNPGVLKCRGISLAFLVKFLLLYYKGYEILESIRLFPNYRFYRVCADSRIQTTSFSTLWTGSQQHQQSNCRSMNKYILGGMQVNKRYLRLFCCVAYCKCFKMTLIKQSDGTFQFLVL